MASNPLLRGKELYNGRPNVAVSLKKSSTPTRNRSYQKHVAVHLPGAGAGLLRIPIAFKVCSPCFAPNFKLLIDVLTCLVQGPTVLPLPMSISLVAIVVHLQRGKSFLGCDYFHC